MKKINFQKRHGDILCERIGDMGSMDLSKFKKLDRDQYGFLTIEQGAATNNHHGFKKEILGSNSITAYLFEESNGIKKILAEIPEASRLDHFNMSGQKLSGKHDSLTFDVPGIYCFSTRREWDSSRHSLDEEGNYKPVID